jgi:mono/diheme cytochrome c family protein
MNSEPKSISEGVGAGEPSATRGPVPVWLMLLVFFLIYGGMLAFDLSGGWFDKDVYAPFTSKVELVDSQPVTSHNPMETGFRVYHKPTCVACHQADGKGTPGQFPSLVKSEWIDEQEPGRIIRIVLNGLTGELKFNGQTFNGTMVPWKDVLNDEEIADVLTFVRQNKEWGNNAPAVAPERVAAVREKIKDKATPFTPDELMKLSPAD